MKNLGTVAAVAIAIQNYFGGDKEMANVFNDSDALVFGGAVRDALTGKSINDIDIVCDVQSAAVIRSNIKKWKKSDEQNEAFYDLKLFSVESFYLSDNQKIQIIVPAQGTSVVEKLKIKMIKDFMEKIDLRCCCLAFDPSSKTIIEFVDGAFDDCKKLKIVERKDAIFHDSFRVKNRIEKLIKKGWKKEGAIDTKIDWSKI